MKQAVKKVRMITMGIFALYTMGVPQITFAQAKNGDPIELKLISNIKNQPVFQLSLNNDEAAEYYIAVKDAGQNLLYSEKIKGINLLRKYKLAIDESDYNKGLKIQSLHILGKAKELARSNQKINFLVQVISLEKKLKHFTLPGVPWKKSG